MIRLIMIAVVAAILAAGAVWLLRRRRKPLDIPYFQEQWQTLQKQLRDKAKWAEAITEADKLLDTALKKRRVRGHTMGERLVKAQRMFSDNDGLWFGHKLRAKIDADPTTKLKEAEVKQALMGIRQALKDIGALPNGQSGNSK